MSIYLLTITMITIPSGAIQTTILVSPSQKLACQQHGIKLTQALRTGIGILLAEEGHAEYDTTLNLHRKMNVFRQKAEEALQKLAALEAKE